jgi:serine/threonine protein kinase
MSMFAGPLDGRYAIRAEVGTGGHGRVLLAEDLKLGRRVAVKLLGSVNAGSEQEAIQRLEREGRVASAINHPNVCAVSDIGRLPNGYPYLVLELLDGETLCSRLDRVGELPLATALALGEQMLLGLAAAHRIGVVHRDVKTANMFLVNLGHGREQLKLLDFGTALVPGGPPSDGATLTRTGLVVGTVDYMAPEQVRGMRDFDARTDVYAAGVVLYEMITGRRPFAKLALPALCEAIAFKQPPSLSTAAKGVQPSVARAVDLALSVDLKRRHADAGAFLEALRAPASSVADEWELPTSQAGAAGATARPVGVDPDEWEHVTHRMVPPAVGTSTIDVDLGAKEPRSDAEGNRPAGGRGSESPRRR